MKVLIYGKDKTFRKMCQNCDSLLEYTHNDIYYILKNDWERGYITCPECNTKILVKSNFKPERE
jgi:DNA-directed RNA polymerase subunit RPC12/RpoP